MSTSTAKALFSSDPKSRERTASSYRVFAQSARIPKQFREDWKELLGDRRMEEGLAWPEELARLAHRRRWPKYAFGTANASCLLVMHRPGLGESEHNVESLDRVLFIKPRVPVLGGIPHAHNAVFPGRYNTNPTWAQIHKYLKPAFRGLRHPWSQLMTCNINPEHGHYGETDGSENLRGLPLLDHVVSLCRPKVVLLCGGDVHKATETWSVDAEVLRVAHPSWWQRTSMNLPNGVETAAMARKILFG